MVTLFKKTIRFIKEGYKIFRIVWMDNLAKKGHSADIRIATIGFPLGHVGPWFGSLIAERTGKKVKFSWYNPSLILTSLFGSAWLVKILLLLYDRPSVFFSGENITTLRKYREYRSYLGSLPTLAMGFDYRQNSNYRRVPLWLFYIFSPEFVACASIRDIQEKLDTIEQQSHFPKQKFAAMIASHEGYCSRRKIDGGAAMVSRAEITQQVATIDFVNCPGKLLHNDDSLQDEFGDDKKKYLKQFQFNICSENAASPGYVTEKIFESIEAGAIPVYWGDDNPEPAILNHARILFWQEGDNRKTLEVIETLNMSENERMKFLSKPIFKETAAEEIFRYFEILNNEMVGLLLEEALNEIY